jgi:ferritin-like metal-binding protein YciE
MACDSPADKQLIAWLNDAYSMEHFEIACYRSLIAAADEAGRPEIVKICEEILREEEAMARWLEQRIHDVAKMSLLQAPAAR